MGYAQPELESDSQHSLQCQEWLRQQSLTTGVACCNRQSTFLFLKLSLQKPGKGNKTQWLRVVQGLVTQAAGLPDSRVQVFPWKHSYILEGLDSVGMQMTNPVDLLACVGESGLSACVII